MTRPFELSEKELKDRLDEMVSVTFEDIQSQFLVLPKGNHFIEYAEFSVAYEVLKRETNSFAIFTSDAVWSALRADALSLVVLRTILGLSPVEWADLARSECDNCKVTQNDARDLDRRVRKERQFFSRSRKETKAERNTKGLVQVAVDYISRGAPAGAEDTVHRLAKVDTTQGLSSLRNAAALHVPYAVLLYERYLGRPFASHRDSVSELVGDVMESAIEEVLSRRRISFRKTKRAERIADFDQAPDFFIPDEQAPSVVIEAKITGDDGTARDKVSRILRLAQMRDARPGKGLRPFEVVACVDGRGFGVRKQDMRDLLTATKGKVFTLASLDMLVDYTGLKSFLPKE